MRRGGAALACWALLACAAPTAGSGGGTTPPDAGKGTMHEDLTDLDTLARLIGTKQDEFVKRHGYGEAHVRPHAVYERLADLDEVHDPSVSPVRFFFHDGRLVLAYLEGKAVAHFDVPGLEARLGPEAVRLRSRAGKASNLMVRADKGVAASLSDEVDFIQVFRPMSHEAYLQTIYQDPGNFVL
jgi:hypothetical protein